MIGQAKSTKDKKTHFKGFGIILFVFMTADISAEDTNTLKMDLKTAERMAQTASIDLQLQNAERSLINANILEKWRAFLPQLRLSYLNNEQVRIRDFDTRSHQFRADLTQPIWDGGTMSLAHDLSKLDGTVLNFKYRQLTNKVILDTRTNFFRMLQGIYTVESRQKSADRAELQAKLSKKEFEVGTLTKIEYLDVVSKYKQIVVSLLREKRDYESLDLTFKQGLRLNPRLELLIDKETLHRITFREIDKPFEELFAIAMENRIEVRQRSIDALRYKKEYEIAQSYNIPRISLTGNYNISGDRFPPLQNGWGIGVIVTSNAFGSTVREAPQAISSTNGYTQGYSTDTSVGIFDDLSYRRKKIESGMNLKRGLFEQERLPDLLAIEVKNALLTVEHNFAIFKMAEDAEKVLSERIKIQTAKVRLGQLKRVDLMLAEIEYLGVAQNFIKAKADYLISIASLENSLGVRADYLGLIDLDS